MKRPFVAAVVLLCLFAGVVLLLTRPAGTATGAAPKVGRAAPDFTLSAIDGQQVHLASHRGRTVLLDFFATWCVPCRQEMPAIDQVYRGARNRLVVLAIDKQEPASDVQQFVTAHHLAFAPLLDPNLTVWNRYGVTIQPVSFWIDPRGTIRAIHYGAMDSRFMRRELRTLAG